MVLVVSAEPGETIRCRVPVIIVAFYSGKHGFMPGEGIKQVTLGVAFHQGLVCVLSVDIYQVFSQRL